MVCCYLCMSLNATIKCDQCPEIMACSEDHIRVHKGKEKCFPFEIHRLKDIGKVMIASRTILPGETVLIESPSVWGPDSKSKPVCLNCLQPCLSSTNNYLCSTCHFPVCNRECETGPQHSMECSYLSVATINSKIQFNPEQNCFPYSSIIPLRLLQLRQSNPDLWKRIDLLMDHISDLEPEVYDLYSRTVDFIIQDCKAPYNREDILRSLGIFRTNGVNQGFSMGFALYPTFSFLSHGCISNARYHIYKNRNLVLRAMTKIEKGQEITISYLPVYQGTFRRRMKIKNNWLFDCQCIRCVDPTELGSYLGGVLCQKCPSSGILLPRNPLDPTSPWICDSRDCKDVMESETVVKMIFLLENEIERYKETDPEVVESQIRIWSRILHKNHYLLFLMKRRLLDLLSLVVSNIEDKNVRRKYFRRILELGEEIITVVRILEPGYSVMQGRILKQMHRPWLKLTEMDFKEGRIDKRRFLERTQISIRNMKLAVKCLEDFGSTET